MIKLRRYLAYYKKECIIGPLCKLFEAILELLVPLVMAGIIDNGVRNGDTAYIWRMGGLLVILATVGLCSALVCQYLDSRNCKVYTKLWNCNRTLLLIYLEYALDLQNQTSF